MKKILLLIFFNLFFYKIALASPYYFKECKINENVSADYIINIDKNIIEVDLKVQGGVTQKLQDKIKLITDDQVTSEIIQSGAGENNYFQYYLNAKSKSVIKQMYQKVGDIFRLSGPIRKSYCIDVKADWDNRKIKEDGANKEQEEALKTQKKIAEEQSSLSECEGDNFKKWTNCRGSYLAEDGTKFIGKFQNGEIIKGTASYPGGTIYFGEFKFSKPNGQGTFKYSNGSIHSGEWKDGKGEGQGVKTWKDGKEYAGEFKNDKPDGKGTFTYLDGSKYIGDWQDGKKHGNGTLKYSDGKTYIGKFVAGEEHGQGICINVDGDSINCTLLKVKDKKSVKINKNRRSISIEAKKWVSINEYESNSGKGKKIINKLENDFDAKAFDLCSSMRNFDVLEKRINVLEIDETPSFGTVAKVKLGIEGVVECK